MYSIICANAELLLRDSKLSTAVRSYSRLMDELRHTDVSRDIDYQAEYRRFWAINAARWSAGQVDHYFRLLEHEKNRASPNVERAVRSLAKVDGEPATIQLSFASKLVHMIEPTAPVYDSLVAAFYHFNTPAFTTSHESRLAKLLGFYSFLESEYERVISAGIMGSALRQFRLAFPEAADFTDQKLIDFLIWTYVRVLRSGAQLRGELLYS